MGSIFGWLRPSGGQRLGAGPRRRVRMFLARHRRPIGIVLVLAAIWLTIRSAAPPPPPTLAVTVASRDLPAGSTLTGADVHTVRWPASLAPPQRVTSSGAAGHVLSGPIGAGEAVTAQRLLGPGLLAGQPAGTVVATIRAADPASLIAIRPGDRIDVLATDQGATAMVIAARALVLSKPAAANDAGDDGGWAGAFGGSGAAGSSASSAASMGTSSGSSGVLVLAVDRPAATRLAAAANTQPLTAVLLGNT